jgi:REase_AHJR-like
MTPSTLEERERQRLVSVASEYESQGYAVKLQPPPDDLPAFLAGLSPDLIATGKGETVVVEVKARDELKDAQYVSALENAIRNRLGWRFELVIDGPAFKNRSIVGAAQIRDTLQETNDLQQHGHLAAALLLLWSATEGALRLLAEREKVELESSFAPGYLIRRLYTLGLLGREQYTILEDAVRLRNQAAHGFHVAISSQDLTRLASVSHELLREVEAKAA